MIPKGSPKGFAYAAINLALHVLAKNSTDANLTQQVCSTWSLCNPTHHNVFLTPQIDMTQLINGMSKGGHPVSVFLRRCGERSTMAVEKWVDGVKTFS